MSRVIQIVCVTVLCCVLKSQAQNGRHAILGKEISISAQEQKLEKILDEISAKTGLYFSYDPTVFNIQKKITVNFQNQKISQVLDDLFQDEYSYRLLKNQVIITKDGGPQNQFGLYQSEIQGKIITITGHIRDRSSNSEIPYASIAILGKAFGTITNIDGDFELKIPETYQKDTLYVSCMGYAQQFVELDTLQSGTVDLSLSPIDIRLHEIRVTAINPLDIIDQLLKGIAHNYPEETYLMTSFYREVLKQDDKYINASEAVMNILKAPYANVYREDRIRFIKGRKSPDVLPFKFVDFKMQGGPYYITKLDVIKTMDSFLDKNFRYLYNYEADHMIEYFGRPTYVINFKPIEKVDFLSYEGKLFIDKENFALVHAEFQLGKEGLKIARQSLIRKKPKDFRVRPIDLKYQVTYKENNGRWHLNTAQTSVKFRVRSKRDKINSVFHSVSDLLITQHKATKMKHFDREETVSSTDIFTEMIIDYDQEFWGHFNIIKPDEDLVKTLEGIKFHEETNYKQLSDPDKFTIKYPN